MTAPSSLAESFPRCSWRWCPDRSRRWIRFWRRQRDGVLLNGRWHCGPQCLEPSLEELYSQLLPAVSRRRPVAHRVPIGLLLLSMGMVDPGTLREALQAQKESGGGRVGDWLRQAGVVTEQQVTTALGMQWSCAVFPLESHRRVLECAGLVPLPLLESSRMVAVHYLPASRFLYMAFADGIDYAALYGIERMLDCRTEACLASQTSLEQALEELRALPHPLEVLFDSVTDPKELARTTRSYAVELGVQEVRVVNCGAYLWARLAYGGQASNLLFQV